MDTKQELQNLALETNDLLSEYIRIHDKILNKAGRPITIFKKVNFGELFNDCQKISGKSDQKKEKIYSFQSIKNQLQTDDEKIYLNQLVLFIEKLDITIKLLTEKQKLLFEKSGGNREAQSNERTYSLFSRLNWLPVFEAPIKTYFLRIILPTIVFSVIASFYMQKTSHILISIALCIILLSWLFSLTYGKSRKSVTWREYKELEKKYQQSINEYLAAGAELNKLNNLIFTNT